MIAGEAYSKLNHEKKKEVRELVRIVLEAVTPNDPTGHLPNCGYTDLYQVCDCSNMGTRLFDGLAEHVSKE